MGLMTFSVIGVVFIQAYWLRNAYELKEEKFDREVGQALVAVSHRLEQMESLRFLQEGLNWPAIFSSQLSPGRGSDSSASALKLTMRLGGDTVLEFNSGNAQGGVTTYREGDSLPREVMIRTAPDQMLEKGLQLDRLLRKLVNHEKRRGELSRFLEAKTVDSLLAYELKSRGIAVPYRFAIQRGEEILLHSETWLPGQISQQAALFPNDLLARHSLLIYFPRKGDYLFRSMGTMAGLSLLFSAAILFAFFRTLNYSFRQKRISEIRTDFINNMTHEFKTPLATINLAIDAMASPTVRDDAQKQAHYRHLIKQENQRMNLQVESVLRMALMDRQELQLNLKQVRATDLIEEAIEHLRLSLERRNGTLRRFFNDGGQKLMLDAQHFTNAIINILDNAIKYSKGDPQIQVSTEQTGNYFIICIADQGVGMSKEERKHIFDRFYRISTGNLHNVKGHGLGLSYVKAIVEAHKGRVEVESERGKGSRFYLYLPQNH